MGAVRLTWNQGARRTLPSRGNRLQTSHLTDPSLRCNSLKIMMAAIVHDHEFARTHMHGFPPHGHPEPSWVK